MFINGPNKKMQQCSRGEENKISSLSENLGGVEKEGELIESNEGYVPESAWCQQAATRQGHSAISSAAGLLGDNLGPACSLLSASPLLTCKMGAMLLHTYAMHKDVGVRHGEIGHKNHAALLCFQFNPHGQPLLSDF